MDQEDLLWRLEREYWACGSGNRENSAGPSALIVLAPDRILEGADLAAAHRDEPCWEDVDLYDRHLAYQAIGLAVLAYKVSATHAAQQEEFRATCSSVWMREHGHWMHIQHHRTFVAPEAAAA
ncbi:hypothetical protein DXV76_04875 [Rhodobacteraceae bacterium CCMM004]|nr:hypothetical protein DXV76_04875 [Rhodobacteraceae bacterium CCMM004]